jgi:hypothetical protein
MLSAGALGEADPKVAATSPEELGQVRWLRDYDQARKKAAKAEKPLCVLFDEVPGCATCKKFGQGPLSHPVVISACESLFVPVAVYNNVKGTDLKVLKQFKEPAWNNPVVRFINPADGKDLLPRKDRIFTAGGLLERMARALEAAGQEVPAYLSLTLEEYAAPEVLTVTFSMACYNEGDKRLGAMEGVIWTRLGWMGRNEVVEVSYNPKKVSLKELTTKAKQVNCAKKVYVHRKEDLEPVSSVVGKDGAAFTEDRVRTKQVRQRLWLAQQVELFYLPLTRVQATRINARLANRREYSDLLSPDQAQILGRLKKLSRGREAHGALRRALDALEPDRRVEGIGAYRLGLLAWLADQEKPAK